MQSELLVELRAREITIRRRWADLLRVEPVSTPLGNPDALTHLIGWTFDELVGSLEAAANRPDPSRRMLQAEARPTCACGRNPLLMYFAAGEQVMREALVLAQAAMPHLDPIERDAALQELDLAFRQIARREVEVFCGVCQFRQAEAPCAHAPAAAT
jgi:hypothetical protein